MSKREEDVLRYVMQNADRFVPPDVQLAQEVEQYVLQNQERFAQPVEQPGMVQRYGGGLLDLLAGIYGGGVRGFASPQDVSQVQVFASGFAEQAIIKPLQGVAGFISDVSRAFQNVPGGEFLRLAFPQSPFALGPEVEETFSRVEDFALRAREGILTDAEVNAASAGVQPFEIAALRGLGQFVGFTSPMVASYKMATLAFNVPKVSALRYPLVASLPEDFVAGAVFGGLFQPGKDMQTRLKHAINESAVFGVGRLVFNGLLFPWAGARARRFHLLKESGKIDEMMGRLREGRPLVLDEGDASIVAQLLTEEEYVANSLGAQIFIEKGNARAAIVQGIIDSAEAGSSSGVIRGIGLDFSEVTSAVSHYRNHFPRLKFDIIKNKKTGNYDIVFGTQGLSNLQKKQMKSTGRFQGLMLEKNGTRYEYVSQADFRKGDPRPWINVRTFDGKVTQIADDGVTDLFTYREKVTPNETLNRLYADFEQAMEREIRELVPDAMLDEANLIRGIRNGSITFTDDARRAFIVNGAIVHPEELGLPMVGEGAIQSLTFHKLGPDGSTLRTGRLMRIGDYRDQGPWGFVEYGQNISDPPKRTIRLGATLQEAAQQMQKAEWQPAGIRYTTERAQDVMEAISRQGTDVGNMLPNTFPYISFDDAVTAWAQHRGLPTDAPDFPAVRSFFASRYREKMWRSVPDEDRAVFDAIRDEFIKLTESGEIPLTAQAWNKGIHLERKPDGTIDLRDIRSGARITVQNEASARAALNKIHRPDNDMVETLIPFEGHGLGGMTGGWEHPGQNLYFGDHVDPAVFMSSKDAPFLMKLRNVRDLFTYVEEKTKFPLFTQVFDDLDIALTRMRTNLEPYAMRIQDIWKDVPRRGKGNRYELAEWWTEIEGSDLTMKEAVRFLKDKGATTQQIVAFRKARKMFDLFFEMSGIEKGRFIHHYYSRVRPWVEEHGVSPDLEQIFGKGSVPPEYKFWAEYARTGDLAMIEKDPELVMHRYARALFFKSEVSDIFNKARNLVVKKTAPRIKDLPKDIRAEILASSPHATPEDMILPPQVVSVLSEYLNIVRGTPEASVQGLRDFTTRFFKSMKIDADERVLENVIDIYISNMYGAAMGLRPTLVARNVTQTIWTQYTRLGGRHGGVSLRVALTYEGFIEAVRSGAIRSTTAGIPQGDAIWAHMLDESRLEGTGIVSSVFAGALRLGMRLGHVSSKISRKMLVPYSSADDMNRAWSYWWQKLFTEEHLNYFEAGKIPWEKFLDDGLPFFSHPTKIKFQKIYNSQGKEQALRWIGKIAADEAHFIYGVGAQPALLQKPVGRLVGMFGTWPLWALELYFSRMWKGTPRQRAALAVRTAALVGAFSNMIVQSGFDLWNWIAPTSVLGWAGGPVVDHTINLKRVWDAPPDQKATALGNLAKNVGRLILPGQIFLTSDIPRAFESDNPAEAGLKIMLGRPVDEYNFSLEVLYDPNNLQNIQMYLPEQPPQPPPVVRPGGTEPLR